VNAARLAKWVPVKSPHSTAIRATAEDIEEDIADTAADETMTRRAINLLSSKRNGAYEAALAAL